jgi:hypothetical protein
MRGREQLPVVRRRRRNSPPVEHLLPSNVRPHSDRPPSPEEGQAVNSQHTTCTGKTRNWKGRGKKLIRLSIIAVVLVKVCILPLLALLLGNGYDRHGGFLGILTDAILRRYYLRFKETQSPQLKLLAYPVVTERTRRRKLPGRSRFLEELLRRHSEHPNGHQANMSETHILPAISQYAKISESLTNPDIGTSETLQQKLVRERCHPGWLCQRCLTSSRWGSIHNCRAICSKCYSKLLCDAQEFEGAKGNQSLPITLYNPIEQASTSFIPRIIHQEFDQEILSWRHPELHRAQNSWRATGWEYRFYTAPLARDFVQRHFQSTVLDAYDSLPRQSQSSLFRLLVLLIEGGVFADIGLMLETDLDTLLSETIGFVAARDDSVDGSRNHCLWNGLMAARPGHPFLAAAVDIFIVFYLHHKDEDDIEAMVCSTPREPLWKLRATSFHDNLVGSCAVGMAVHSTLRENLLTPFCLGRMKSFADEEVLILLVWRALRNSKCARCLH